MALAIDTVPLAQALIPRLQRYLDQYTERYQIHRLCVHATVIHDASAFRRLLVARERLANQEALDWQADQGDDLDEGEVFKHLQQQAATSPLLSKTLDRTNTVTTTLFASALSPSFATRTRGRALSFHRHSLRCSCLKRNQVLSHGFAYSSAIPNVFPSAGAHYAWVYFPDPDLNIVWERNAGYKPFVVWNMQLDIVDLWTRITTTYNSGIKRRRTGVNQFLEVSPVAVDTGRDDDHEAKRFRGVRYRRDRRAWVAEMRPYKGKSKVQFGEFKSQADAASAVDAAYHHYNKPQLLNFPDRTPQILSSRPRPAISLEDEGQKLRFVKAEAKWLGSIAESTLPFSSIPAPSGCSPGSSAVDIWFRSFSEISSLISCGGGGGGGGVVDELTDDGNSHQGPITAWMHVPTSVHITDGWDADELISSGTTVMTNSVMNSPSQVGESQGICLPF